MLSKKSGQSLIEILVALGVGSLMIGGIAAVLAVTLRSQRISGDLQVVSVLNDGLLEKIRTVAGSDWSDVYGLNKGSANPYFLVASGTELAVIPGKAGLLENDTVSGLIGHWGFDETAGNAVYDTYDSTRFNNDGKFVNGPIRAPNCKISSCLAFAKADKKYVSVGGSGAVDLTNASSVSVWIKPSWVNDKIPRLVLGKGKGNGINLNNFSWLLLFTDHPLAYINGVSGSDFNFFPVVTPENEWAHIAMTYDRVNLKTYLNGKLFNSIPFSDSVDPSVGNPVGIGGAFSLHNNYFFDGLIDDARIYNRVLSDDEILALYANKPLTQYFFVENVSRNISGDIVSVGGADDPRTQKATVKTEWFVLNNPASVTVSAFLTRWRNETFRQTDWSGGAGAGGPFTEPNNLFSSAVNIDLKNGSIKIQGL